MFTSALSNLESLTWHKGDFHEAESFYFSVFSKGKDSIDREGEWWEGRGGGDVCLARLGGEGVGGGEWKGKKGCISRRQGERKRERERCRRFFYWSAPEWPHL